MRDSEHKEHDIIIPGTGDDSRALKTGITDDMVVDAIKVLGINIDEKLQARALGGGANSDFLTKLDAVSASLLLISMQSLHNIITEKPMDLPDEGMRLTDPVTYQEDMQAVTEYRLKHQANVIKATAQIVNLVTKRLPTEGLYNPAAIIGGKRYPIPILPQDWGILNGELQHVPTMRHWKQVLETARYNEGNSAVANRHFCKGNGGRNTCIFADEKPQITESVAADSDDGLPPENTERPEQNVFPILPVSTEREDDKLPDED